jgi:hypothetical protein
MRANWSHGFKRIVRHQGRPAISASGMGGGSGGPTPTPLSTPLMSTPRRSQPTADGARSRTSCLGALPGSRQTGGPTSCSEGRCPPRAYSSSKAGTSPRTSGGRKIEPGWWPPRSTITPLMLAAAGSVSTGSWPPPIWRPSKWAPTRGWTQDRTERRGSRCFE